MLIWGLSKTGKIMTGLETESFSSNTKSFGSEKITLKWYYWKTINSFFCHSIRSGRPWQPVRDSVQPMLSPYPGPQMRKPLWIGTPYLWAYSPCTCLRGSYVSLKRFHNVRELRVMSQSEISQSWSPQGSGSPSQHQAQSGPECQPQSGKKARRHPWLPTALLDPQGRKSREVLSLDLQEQKYIFFCLFSPARS